MATALFKQDLMQGNHLRKQLAVAVRSIKWGYAIFWYDPTKQQGGLKWNDGCYNGDSTTRKTLEPMELHVDKLGLKRSQQLKELYEWLSVGDTTEQAKRPSTALSPEDLTDTEWYYLVCMSFTFAPGVGLPGRAFASGEHIWLCNAQDADSKLFNRSLLAKSASIQTVVCIPLLGGVIELGATDLVTEDLNLLQHIKTVFMEFPKFICSENFFPNPPNDEDDENHVCGIGHNVGDTLAFEKLSADLECGMTEVANQDFETVKNILKGVQTNLCEDLKADFPGDCSNEIETYQQIEGTFMTEGTNGVGSQVQSWQFMDGDYSNCVPVSMNTTDCISQTYLNPEKNASPLKQETANNVHQQDTEECGHKMLSSLDAHYTKMLSVILGNSNHLISAPCSGDKNKKSSFAVWNKGSSITPQMPQRGSGQQILKKSLFDVPLMHGDWPLKSKEGNSALKGLCGEDIDVSAFILEEPEQTEDPSLVLRSLLPSISKFDKSFLNGDTIEYMKDLERRLKELESRGRRKSGDTLEKTSDHYCKIDTTNEETPPINKRKAYDIDEMEGASPIDGIAGEISVWVEEEKATIEIHVPWRESLLVEILDAIRNLKLDTHSVISSTFDGTLTLSLKSKFQGARLLTAGTIRLALQKVLAAVRLVVQMVTQEQPSSVPVENIEISYVLINLGNRSDKGCNNISSEIGLYATFLLDPSLSLGWSLFA